MKAALYFIICYLDFLAVFFTAVFFAAGFLAAGFLVVTLLFFLVAVFALWSWPEPF